MDKTEALARAATKYVTDRPEALRIPANSNSRVQAAMSPTSQGKEIAFTDALAQARSAGHTLHKAGVTHDTPAQQERVTPSETPRIQQAIGRSR